MKIKAGERYITRYGSVTGPVYFKGTGDKLCGGFVHKSLTNYTYDRYCVWGTDGRYYDDGTPSEWDLIQVACTSEETERHFDATPKKEVEAGGTKNDSNKPPMSLIPEEALAEIAKVMAHGAQKYGKNNYKSGFKRSRLLDAALRHILSDCNKQDLDSESGLLHVAHAAASLCMLIQNIKTNKSTDDR